MERIVCLLILLSVKLFAQDEFIFWAELSSKNFILFHQNESLSLAMTKSTGVREELACELAYEEKDLSYLQKTSLGSIDDDMPKSLKFRFLNTHKDKLLDCFKLANVRVQNSTQTHLFQARTSTYMKIVPIRFRVYFGNNSALIYHLIKK